MRDGSRKMGAKATYETEIAKTVFLTEPTEDAGRK
jgi:hypothetical protein